LEEADIQEVLESHVAVLTEKNFDQLTEDPEAVMSRPA
jgi:hypothetical protein